MRGIICRYKKCDISGFCYVTLKFLSTYRFLWGHEVANSFLLLRLHSSFLQMIMDITWYNPPFDSNVKINLGRKFLRIVDKYGDPLRTKLYR